MEIKVGGYVSYTTDMNLYWYIAKVVEMDDGLVTMQTFAYLTHDGEYYTCRPYDKMLAEYELVPLDEGEVSLMLLSSTEEEEINLMAISF